MSRMFAGFSSMLLLSLYGSIVSHADLAGAVSLLSVPSPESNVWSDHNAQLRGSEISASFGALTGDMKVEDDYILVPDTGRSRSKATRQNPSMSDIAVFKLYAALRTEVVLEFEVLTPTLYTDSFHVWIDDITNSKVWRPNVFTSFTWAD